MGMHSYSPPPLLEIKLPSGAEAVIDLRQVVAVELIPSDQRPTIEGIGEGGDCTVVYLCSGRQIGFGAPEYAEVKAAWKRAMS